MRLYPSSISEHRVSPGFARSLWSAPSLLALWLLLPLPILLPSPAAEQKAHEFQWQQAIQFFEAADKTNPPPPNAVLFIGSSSIRLWTTLQQDFPGYKV